MAIYPQNFQVRAIGDQLNAQVCVGTNLRHLAIQIDALKRTGCVCRVGTEPPANWKKRDRQRPDQISRNPALLKAGPIPPATTNGIGVIGVSNVDQTKDRRKTN